MVRIIPCLIRLLSQCRHRTGKEAWRPRDSALEVAVAVAVAPGAGNAMLGSTRRLVKRLPPAPPAAEAGAPPAAELGAPPAAELGAEAKPATLPAA